MNTRSPSRQSPPSERHGVGRATRRDGAVPNVPEGLRTTRRLSPASSRNRWASAGGGGAARRGGDHRHPAPGGERRSRERHLDEPAPGLGHEQGLEHLGHRVALAPDLEHQHVVRAEGRPGDLDLRPGGPPMGGRTGPRLELPAAPQGDRLGLGQDADRLRDERLALDDAPLPGEDGPVDDPALDGRAEGADPRPPMLLDRPLGQEGDAQDRGGGRLTPRQRRRPPIAASEPERPTAPTCRQPHRAVIVWSAPRGIKGKEKRPRGSPPWGVGLPGRS